MKYKTKYIKERGLVGGALGTKQCPPKFGVFGFTSKSVWWYIREYNCTYDDLKKNIPEKVNAITFKDFLHTNREPKHAQQQITIADLKSRGFPVEFLKSKGFIASALEKGKFTASELKKVGFSARELKNGGFSADELREVGFSVKEAGFSVEELDRGGEYLNLKSDGFTAKELNEAGFSLHRVTYLGYTLPDLRNAGFSMSDLKKMYNLQEFKDAGFSAYELKKAGFLAIDLINVGFDKEDLRRVYNSNTLFLLDNIGNLTNLFIDSSPEINWYDFKNAGISIYNLKKAGASALYMIKAGFSVKNLKDNGYKINEIYDVWINMSKLDRRLYFSADALRNAFTVKELKNAGFEAKDIILKTDIYEENPFFRRSTVEEGDIKILTKERALEFISAGYPLLDLLLAGMTKQQLLDAKADIRNLTTAIQQYKLLK